MQNHTLQTLDVSCGLIWREGRLLATQRLDHQQHGGLWEFPGGKVEPQETRAECLHRELEEELAIEVKIEAAWPVVEDQQGPRLIRLWPFLCLWQRGEPQLLAHQALSWLSHADRLSVNWAPADRRLAASLSPQLWSQ